MSQTSQRPKKVGDLVSDKIDLSRHVEIDLAGLRHVCDKKTLSRYMYAENYENGPWFDKVIAKIKWCSFFDSHGIHWSVAGWSHHCVSRNR